MSVFLFFPLISILAHLYFPLLLHQEAVLTVGLVVAHQGVLEVPHGVQGASLHQERAGMEGSIELDQDNGNILTGVNLFMLTQHNFRPTSRAASACPLKRKAFPRKVRTAMLSGCICAALGRCIFQFHDLSSLV